MCNRTLFQTAAVAAFLLLSAATHSKAEVLIGLGEKAEKLSEDRKPLLGFTSYFGLGGGAAWIGDEVTPDVRFEAGWQITPWFGLASFGSAQPLEAISGVVPEEDAYAYRYGTSLSFTPLSRNRFHPLIRVTLGGINVGYRDTSVAVGKDEKEFFREKAFFAAGAEGGVEINLSRHFRAIGWAGWRFADVDFLGLEASDFNRPEVGLELKATWRTLIY